MGEQKNLLLAILASLVVLLGFQLLFPAEKIPQNNTVQESESSFTPSPEVITEMPKARNEIISESERIKINNISKTYFSIYKNKINILESFVISKGRFNKNSSIKKALIGAFFIEK